MSNMSNIKKIHSDYIDELESFIGRSLNLLLAAKIALSNQIGRCTVEGCTEETPCTFCQSWQDKWDEIDEFIAENQGVVE